jgi:small-conductance mechanosensitive channel/CRP-like cAMP-binding protein
LFVAVNKPHGIGKKQGVVYKKVHQSHFFNPSSTPFANSGAAFMTLIQSLPIYAPYIAGGVGVLLLIALIAANEDRRWVAICGAVFYGAMGLAYATFAKPEPFSEFAFGLALLLAGLAVFSIAGTLFFRVMLPLVNVTPPRILQDITIALAYLVWGVYCLHAFGVSVAGILTTSAVLTAVIGFSMQDTLGNILAGLALQLDRSIRVGDFIQVDNQFGCVVEIRWRYTAVQTPNWETMVIPNSVLMKNRFLILGRRIGEPVQWRRWIYFNVDYKHAPQRVIEVVEKSLRSAEILYVAKNPPIHCLFIEYSDSFAKYAIRYWCTNLFIESPTDSEIRVHLYSALQRAGIALATPTHAILLTQDTVERKARKNEEEVHRRIGVLQRLELFSKMQEQELRHLAELLSPAPFVKGDIITRQGSKAHNLYIISDGHVDIVVENAEKQSTRVADLGPGQFFGEIGLLTGEPRVATVIATTAVQSYRLDKESLQDIMKARPAIAEEVSHVLAQRQTELNSILHNLDEETRAKKLASEQNNILGKIRSFFSLDK